MAELADALDLGSSGESRAGSSPVIRIFYIKKYKKGVHITYETERTKERIPLLILAASSNRTIGNPTHHGYPYIRQRTQQRGMG